MKRGIFTMLMVFAVMLTACTSADPMSVPTVTPMNGMASMEGGDSRNTGQFAPLVNGYYNGGEVRFIHTEASDTDVANMLTEMMGGPKVVLVPALANAPDDLLANVYVFTNGVEGMGPFGFQPDIFDSIPGETAYRPLRRINLVAWMEGAIPRELCSLEELQAAEAAGEVSITQPGIVVNMPILVWPGSSR